MMENTHTGLLQRNISKVFPNRVAVNYLEILILFLLGFAAIFVHSRLKLHIGVPGNNGLLFMALVIAGRAASTNKSAASIACLSASLFSFMPFFGFENILMPLTFFLPGVIIDLFYNSFAKINQKYWFYAIAGGLALMVVPIIRIIISLLISYPYMAMIKFGVAVPLLTHLMFGVVGGLVGVGIVKIMNYKL